MAETTNTFFFRCSVSEDLWGASPNLDGKPLPTPGGGKWLPLAGIDDLGEAKKGYVDSEAKEEIRKWGCHWFTSDGTRSIIWGDEVPPTVAAKTES